MKHLLILSLLFFFSAKLSAQEYQTVYLHNFPAKEKNVSMEIIYNETTINNHYNGHIDSLVKEILFILIEKPQITKTPQLLGIELNNRIVGIVQINNLIFKP